MSHSQLSSKATAWLPCFWPGLVAIANAIMSRSVEILYEIYRTDAPKFGMRFVTELRRRRFETFKSCAQIKKSSSLLSVLFSMDC